MLLPRSSPSPSCAPVQPFRQGSYIDGTSLTVGQTVSAQSRLFRCHVQNFKANNRKCNKFLIILLLTFSADINPNPDPESSLEQHSYDTSECLPTYYPCGCCAIEVIGGDRAINCNECYMWYHIDSYNIQTMTHSDLGENDSTGYTDQTTVV